MQQEGLLKDLFGFFSLATPRGLQDLSSPTTVES